MIQTILVLFVVVIAFCVTVLIAHGCKLVARWLSHAGAMERRKVGEDFQTVERLDKVKRGVL